MAAHDAASNWPDRRDDRAAGEEVEADGDVVDRAATTLRYGIDQVADKVKGLLRSPR